MARSRKTSFDSSAFKDDDDNALEPVHIGDVTKSNDGNNSVATKASGNSTGSRTRRTSFDVTALLKDDEDGLESIPLGVSVKSHGEKGNNALRKNSKASESSSLDDKRRKASLSFDVTAMFTDDDLGSKAIGNENNKAQDDNDATPKKAGSASSKNRRRKASFDVCKLFKDDDEKSINVEYSVKLQGDGNSNNRTKRSESISSEKNRRRKASFDITAFTISSNINKDDGSVATKTSGNSGTAPVGQTVVGTSALDHLDVLGGCASDDAASLLSLRSADRKPPKMPSDKRSKSAKGGLLADKPDGDENSAGGATRASHTNQKNLLGGIMSGGNDTTDKIGSGTGRGRLDSWGGISDVGGRVRLESWGGMSDIGGGRNRLESWGGMSDIGGGRNRLESWGGMSDASGIAGIGDAALTASALHQTGILEDVTAAAAAIDLPSLANSCVASAASSHSGADNKKVPSDVITRDRAYSLASLSDNSITQLTENEKKDVNKNAAAVAAAMATVSDQLEDLAADVENLASSTGHALPGGSVNGSFPTSLSGSIDLLPELPSMSNGFEDMQKMGVAVTGETIIAGRKRTISSLSDGGAGRKRARSASSDKCGNPITVDYDAVTAAVIAAEAAAGTINLEAIAPPAALSGPQKKVKSIPDKATSSANASLPIAVPPIPKSKLSPKDMEAIRARARAAAGYVPPSEVSGENNGNSTEAKSSRPPVKKRAKHLSPYSAQPSSVLSSAVPYTPTSSVLMTPSATPASNMGYMSSASRGQATVKWEDMYDCLLKYIEQQKAKSLQGKSDKDKAKWEWDGNVPTNYKTPDGKALGRWVNNQRSAKTKGDLKKEREQRLANAGLKWSVLSTNSWTDMMNELKIYIRENTKDGKKWDGNVPTNYKIKGSGATEDGEEKNLGRWINRQRSLYQSGKLKKEREQELENVGLRWSVLSTSSWEAMYEALCKYARQKKANSATNEWDGNVPANYKTTDNPQKSLGRWVNRQRSSYSKKSLCKDHIDKLNKIGLRWAVHDRKMQTPSPLPSSSGIANGLKTPSPYAQSRPPPSATKLVPYNAISGGSQTKLATPVVPAKTTMSGTQKAVAKSPVPVVPDKTISGAIQSKVATNSVVPDKAISGTIQTTTGTKPDAIKSSGKQPGATTATAPVVTDEGSCNGNQSKLKPAQNSSSTTASTQPKKIVV